ncbi:hypothetical protein ACFLQW_02660 [Candidatus Zixiibacteriota bacterium]
MKSLVFKRLACGIMIFVSLGLFLTSCGDKPTAGGKLVINPYGFSKTDIEDVSQSLKQVISAESTLVSLGEVKSNPYEFSIDDTVFAHRQWQQAVTNLGELEFALVMQDYSVLDYHIQSLDEIEAGLSYWKTERLEVTSGAIPYWQTEYAFAAMSEEAGWIEFCAEMVEIQELRLVMIDSTILGIQKDSLLHTLDEKKPSGLNPYQIHQSDIDAAEATLRTLGNLEGKLQVIVDTGNLDNYDRIVIIPNQSTINEGREYWSAEIQLIDSISRPYWHAQYELAAGEAIQQWIDLCKRMIGSLDYREAMGYAILEDLNYDEAVIHGGSETALEIASRKLQRTRIEIEYFSDLSEVLGEAIILELPKLEGSETPEEVLRRKYRREELAAEFYSRLLGALDQGMALTFADYSELSTFIPPPEIIDDGITYWQAEIELITVEQIPFWGEQVSLATDAGNALWLEFTENMSENVASRLELAQRQVKDLQQDSILVAGLTIEAPAQIVQRKLELLSFQIQYLESLINVLAEGLSLGIYSVAKYAY